VRQCSLHLHVSNLLDLSAEVHSNALPEGQTEAGVDANFMLIHYQLNSNSIVISFLPEELDTEHDSIDR
jgi:hypothetical protein